MKPTERAFVVAMLRYHTSDEHKEARELYSDTRLRFADEIATTNGFNAKQAMSWVAKWAHKGWWEYGVTMRSGWFTPEGIAHFKEVLGEWPSSTTST